MAVGLRHFAQRTCDVAGHLVIDSDNGEQLMYVQDSVSIVLGDLPLQSPGTLYITSKQVIWLNDEDRNRGYAVDFLSISLHAVSRDPEAYPSPCIYAQIETEEDESGESDTEFSVGPQDLSKIKEMRLVPSDPSQLDRLFEVFCECAELNPEPIEEDEEEHNWIYSAEQMDAEDFDGEEPEWIPSGNHVNSIGYSDGDHDLAHSVLQLQINDQRFEDAEEIQYDKGSGKH